jgi:hypothetical protein
MSRTPLFATAKKALAVASHENGVAWPRFGPDTGVNCCGYPQLQPARQPCPQSWNGAPTRRSLDQSLALR